MNPLFTDGPLGTLSIQDHCIQNTMNLLSYYHLQDQPWTELEDQQLRAEYIEQLLDIIQIANLHYKTPGQIANRLKRLGITKNYYTGTRGYEQYKQSTLYREIIDRNETDKQIKETKKREKETLQEDIITDKKERKSRNSKLELIEYIQIQQEQTDKINELTDDVKNMKKDIKEILRLMNAIYDFEAS